MSPYSNMDTLDNSSKPIKVIGGNPKLNSLILRGIK